MLPRRLLSQTIDRLGLRWLVFRSREWLSSRRDPRGGAVDGMALPSSYLRTLVVGTPDRDWFIESGRSDAHAFLALLSESGGAALEQAAVLEWGCGCGRLSRWIAPAAREFHGVDINGRLVRWCVRNLPGRFSTVRPAPPTTFPGEAYDLIIGCSVLTHLREPTARAWLTELARLLKPGGRILLTFHDPIHPAAAPVRDVVEREGWAVRFDQLEGSNHLAAVCTAERLAQIAQPELRLVRHVPSSQSTSLQAVAVFAKAAASTGQVA